MHKWGKRRDAHMDVELAELVVRGLDDSGVVWRGWRKHVWQLMVMWW